MTLPETFSSTLQRTGPPEFNAAEQRVLFGKRTLLLAEDNDDLRFVMECTLRSMGYLVLACPDAHFASSTFHSHGYIDALLTDYEMPGKTGVELARELTAARPTLPVLIITGSVLPVTTMQEIVDRQWTYVSKPCHLPSLATTLKRALGPRAASADQRSALNGRFDGA